MFFLKKLISYFILPPGLIILVLLFISYLTKGRERLASRLSFATAILLYAISIEPVKDFLYRPLDFAYRKPESVQADVIVVLGGGTYNNRELKGSSFKRVIEGFLLYKELSVPIVLSGGASTGLTPESLIMKNLLMEFGVDERFIYADTKSRDTMENAIYVQEICRQINCKRILLVTSGFHMRRAVRTFREFGFEVIPYPVDIRYEGVYNLYSYFPKYTTLKDSTIALREYIGILYYYVALNMIKGI